MVGTSCLPFQMDCKTFWSCFEYQGICHSSQHPSRGPSGWNQEKFCKWPKYTWLKNDPSGKLEPFQTKPALVEFFIPIEHSLYYQSLTFFWCFWFFQVISGSIEILNQCDKLSCCTPLVKWTEPIHVAVSSIQESCLLFISNNFLSVVDEETFHQILKVNQQAIYVLFWFVT